jgi:indole-3-glycerol phosphate synthase
VSITLSDLVRAAERSTARQQRSLSLEQVDALMRDRGLVGRLPGALRNALSGPELAVIAEVKGASPVDGVLREGLDPAHLAATYAAAGAAAISVLTEEQHFGGSLDHLEAVAGAVDLPLLRKDFVVTEYQVARAALSGGSAVLLIAEVLPPARLRELVTYAHSLGLDALVEIHDGNSLPAAVAAGSGLIGVNNRNLSTMRVDREHCLRLADRLPRGIVRVAESGLTLPGHAAAVREAGYDAILVGTALVRADDPSEALRALRRGAL